MDKHELHRKHQREITACIVAAVIINRAIETFAPQWRAISAAAELAACMYWIWVE